MPSNALLLENDDIIKKLIHSGLDSISFSIESIRDNYNMGHGNVISITNIERLLEMKKTLESKTPKVVLQPILFKDKAQDVFEIIRWAGAKRVDRINVVRVDLRFVSDMKRPTVSEEKKIFKEFGRLRKRYHMRVDCLQDRIFDGLPGFIYKYSKHLLRLDSWCYRFQDFIYVNVNGNVHPCCLSEEQIMGNLLEQNLEEIWHGKRFKYLRKHQETFSYCRKCDFLRLRQVV